METKQKKKKPKAKTTLQNGEKPKKSASAVVNQRVSEIVELKTKGYSRKDIIEYSINEGWKVKEGQIDLYIKKANQFFRDNSAIDRAAAISQSRARYEFLFQKAVKFMDFGTAARIQREIDLLDGLKAPKVLQVAPQKIIVGIKPKKA